MLQQINTLHTVILFFQLRPLNLGQEFVRQQLFTPTSSEGPVVSQVGTLLLRPVPSLYLNFILS